MSKPLPILLSVPHAGHAIPDEVTAINLLNKNQIIKDGDEGAQEIYFPLKSEVKHFINSDIARAFIDLNRAENDIRKDGVVKTHTCWDEGIYSNHLSENLTQELLTKYYHPYHTKLSKLANQDVILAIDCHTMAEYGPPISPDKGVKRPLICLGDLNGKSCPNEWIKTLYACFCETFDNDVVLNKPFAGGFVTQYHHQEMPWVQLEISRSGCFSNKEKSIKVIEAITKWYRKIKG